MNLEILREIGLTKNEIKIFLALLKSGPSSATRIAKEAEVHRSKVYDSLKRIISKGIVHYKVQDNKQIFIANSPEELLTVIKEKREKLDREEEKIKEIIPELHGISNTNKEEQSSNVYEGLKGIKAFHNKMLRLIESGKEIDILGIPKEANEVLEAYIQEFHKERIKKRVEMRLLYSYEDRAHVKSRKKMPLTKAKYLNKEIETPAIIWIYENIIGIFSFGEKPICHEIDNKNIALGFKFYFNFLWKTAN